MSSILDAFRDRLGRGGVLDQPQVKLGALIAASTLVGVAVGATIGSQDPFKTSATQKMVASMASYQLPTFTPAGIPEGGVTKATADQWRGRKMIAEHEQDFQKLVGSHPAVKALVNRIESECDCVVVLAHDQKIFGRSLRPSIQQSYVTPFESSDGKAIYVAYVPMVSMKPGMASREDLSTNALILGHELGHINEYLHPSRLNTDMLKAWNEADDRIDRAAGAYAYKRAGEVSADGAAIAFLRGLSEVDSRFEYQGTVERLQEWRDHRGTMDVMHSTGSAVSVAAAAIQSEPAATEADFLGRFDRYLGAARLAMEGTVLPAGYIEPRALLGAAAISDEASASFGSVSRPTTVISEAAADAYRLLAGRKQGSAVDASAAMSSTMDRPVDLLQSGAHNPTQEHETADPEFGM